MNQHASRPVAQGFPLHRRMNGSIQTASPLTTQLRPSSDGGSLRRSLSKSQIPIRTSFVAEGSQPSQQALLHHAQALEQRRQRQMMFSTPQSALQAIRTSSSSSQQQPLESMIKVYEDRLQTDLRDFRVVCTRLIVKEREEKEKWRTLCLKMMKERDIARQRVSALISERETHLASSASAASVVPGPVSESVRESKPSKRTREESNSIQENTQELPSPSSPRPIRSLRSSPIPSPPGSPSASLYNLSTAIPSSSPPPPPPPLTISPTSATSATSTSRSSPSSTPLNIMTFNPARSPNDKTCFDVFGEIDIAETRPVKRRKSYDDSSSVAENKTDQTLEEGEIRESSGEEKDVPPPRPFLIAHTDIMYMPMKGRLFCRACLLDKTTNPSSSHNPKTFPTNVDWNELRDHCVGEHPVACADVARLCPADLHELRRRLYNM